MKTLPKHPKTKIAFENLLKQFFLCLSKIAYLPPDAWVAIAGCISYYVYKKGRHIPWRDGDFYFLAVGLIKEEFQLLGKTIIERFIKEDDVIFVDSKDYEGALIALEEVHLLRLDTEQLTKLKQQYPSINDHFENLMICWFKMLTTRITLNQHKKKERNNQFKKTFPGLAARIPKKDLVLYLEVSDSYFSINQ